MWYSGELGQVSHMTTTFSVSRPGDRKIVLIIYLDRLTPRASTYINTSALRQQAPSEYQILISSSPLPPGGPREEAQKENLVLPRLTIGIKSFVWPQ